MLCRQTYLNNLLRKIADKGKVSHSQRPHLPPKALPAPVTPMRPHSASYSAVGHIKDVCLALRSVCTLQEPWDYRIWAAAIYIRLAGATRGVGKGAARCSARCSRVLYRHAEAMPVMSTTCKEARSQRVGK